MGEMKKMIKMPSMGNNPLMDYNVNLAVCELLYKFFIVIVGELLSLPNILSKHIFFLFLSNSKSNNNNNKTSECFSHICHGYLD